MIWNHMLDGYQYFMFFTHPCQYECNNFKFLSAQLYNSWTFTKKQQRKRGGAGNFCVFSSHLCTCVYLFANLYPQLIKDWISLLLLCVDRCILSDKIMMKWMNENFVINFTKISKHFQNKNMLCSRKCAVKPKKIIIQSSWCAPKTSDLW